MSDQATQLPVRTEGDADQKVQIKVVDYTVATRGQIVDTDGNSHVEMHGNDPASVDRVQRLSEIGAVTPDGLYSLTQNTKPGNVGVIASSRTATPGDTTQTNRLTSIVNGTRIALDIAMNDSAGAPISNTNPLFVTFVDNPGAEVNTYSTSTAVAAGATATNIYTAIGSFVLSSWKASASGKIKAELAIETALASGTYNNRFVEFSSTANPNLGDDLREPIRVSAGIRVKITVTNREPTAQDVYSTVIGHEE